MFLTHIHFAGRRCQLYQRTRKGPQRTSPLQLARRHTVSTFFLLQHDLPQSSRPTPYLHRSKHHHPQEVVESKVMEINPRLTTKGQKTPLSRKSARSFLQNISRCQVTLNSVGIRFRSLATLASCDAAGTQSKCGRRNQFPTSSNLVV